MIFYFDFGTNYNERCDSFVRKQIAKIRFKRYVLDKVNTRIDTIFLFSCLSMLLLLLLFGKITIYTFYRYCRDYRFIFIIISSARIIIAVFDRGILLRTKVYIYIYMSSIGRLNSRFLQTEESTERAAYCRLCGIAREIKRDEKMWKRR